MARCGLAMQLVLKGKAVLTPTITWQDTAPSERSQEKDRYRKIHLDETQLWLNSWRLDVEKESGPTEGGESRFNRDQASFLLEKELVVNGSAGYPAL